MPRKKSNPSRVPQANGESTSDPSSTAARHRSSLDVALVQAGYDADDVETSLTIAQREAIQHSQSSSARNFVDSARQSLGGGTDDDSGTFVDLSHSTGPVGGGRLAGKRTGAGGVSALAAAIEQMHQHEAESAAYLAGVAKRARMRKRKAKKSAGAARGRLKRIAGAQMSDSEEEEIDEANEVAITAVKGVATAMTANESSGEPIGQISLSSSAAPQAGPSAGTPAVASGSQRKPIYAPSAPQPTEIGFEYAPPTDLHPMWFDESIIVEPSADIARKCRIAATLRRYCSIAKLLPLVAGAINGSVPRPRPLLLPGVLAHQRVRHEVASLHAVRASMVSVSKWRNGGAGDKSGSGSAAMEDDGIAGKDGGASQDGDTDQSDESYGYVAAMRKAPRLVPSDLFVNIGSFSRRLQPFSEYKYLRRSVPAAIDVVSAEDSSGAAAMDGGAAAASTLPHTAKTQPQSSSSAASSAGCSIPPVGSGVHPSVEPLFHELPDLIEERAMLVVLPRLSSPSVSSVAAINVRSVAQTCVSFLCGIFEQTTEATEAVHIHDVKIDNFGRSLYPCFTMSMKKRKVLPTRSDIVETCMYLCQHSSRRSTYGVSTQPCLRLANNHQSPGFCSVEEGRTVLESMMQKVDEQEPEEGIRLFLEVLVPAYRELSVSDRNYVELIANAEEFGEFLEQETQWSSSWASREALAALGRPEHVTPVAYICRVLSFLASDYGKLCRKHEELKAERISAGLPTSVREAGRDFSQYVNSGFHTVSTAIKQLINTAIELANQLASLHDMARAGGKSSDQDAPTSSSSSQNRRAGGEQDSGASGAEAAACPSSPLPQGVTFEEAVLRAARVLYALPALGGETGMYLPLLPGEGSLCGSVAGLIGPSAASFGQQARLDDNGCGQVVFEVGGIIAPGYEFMLPNSIWPKKDSFVQEATDSNWGKFGTGTSADRLAYDDFYGVTLPSGRADDVLQLPQRAFLQWNDPRLSGIRQTRMADQLDLDDGYVHNQIYYRSALWALSNVLVQTRQLLEGQYSSQASSKQLLEPPVAFLIEGRLEKEAESDDTQIPSPTIAPNGIASTLLRRNFRLEIHGATRDGWKVEEEKLGIGPRETAFMPHRVVEASIRSSHARLASAVVAPRLPLDSSNGLYIPDVQEYDPVTREKYVYAAAQRPAPVGGELDRDVLATLDRHIKQPLMKHQAQALAWMLQRESYGNHSGAKKQIHGSLPVHPAFYQAHGMTPSANTWTTQRDHRIQDPRPLYVHYGADLFLTHTPPTVAPTGWTSHSGILADEMGTGKTLDVLALAAVHRRPSEEVAPFSEGIGAALHEHQRQVMAGVMPGAQDDGPNECVSGVMKNSNEKSLARWVRCCACSRQCLAAFAEPGTVSPGGAIASPAAAAAIYGNGIVVPMTAAVRELNDTVDRLQAARKSQVDALRRSRSSLDPFLDDEEYEDEETPARSRGQGDVREDGIAASSARDRGGSGSSGGSRGRSKGRSRAEASAGARAHSKQNGSKSKAMSALTEGQKHAKETEDIKAGPTFFHHPITALEQVFEAVGLPLSARNVDAAAAQASSTAAEATLAASASNLKTKPVASEESDSDFESERRPRARRLTDGLAIGKRMLLDVEVRGLIEAASIRQWGESEGGYGRAIGAKRGRSSGGGGAAQGRPSKKAKTSRGRAWASATNMPSAAVELRSCSLDEAPGRDIDIKLPGPTFLCAECRAGAVCAAYAAGGKVKTAATLIVSPDRIVEQWSQEMIEKHIKDVGVGMSTGSEKSASSSDGSASSAAGQEEAAGIGAARRKALRVAVFRGTSKSPKAAADSLLRSLRAAVRHTNVAVKNFDKLLIQAARYKYHVERASADSSAVADNSRTLLAQSVLEQLRREDGDRRQTSTAVGFDEAWADAKRIVANGSQAMRDYEVAFHDCQFAASMLDPLTFSQSYDVVVTSFSTLKKELTLAQNTLRGIQNAQEGVFGTRTTVFDPERMCYRGTRESMTLASPLQRAVFNAASAARQMVRASRAGKSLAVTSSPVIESYSYSAAAAFESWPHWLPSDHVDSTDLPAIAAALAARLGLVYQARGGVHRKSARLKKSRRGGHSNRAEIPSPLVMLDFWRVVLDEAQMIEPAREMTLAVAVRKAKEGMCTLELESARGLGSVGVAQAAQMLEHIPSTNRWCVSGTPLRSSLMDLFPLLRFMKVHPFDSDLGSKFGHVLGAWLPGVGLPYGRAWIESAAQQLMSRVQFADTEIRVPRLDYDVVRVPLSPMEEANYQDLFQSAEKKLAHLIAEWRFIAASAAAFAGGLSSSSSASASAAMNGDELEGEGVQDDPIGADPPLSDYEASVVLQALLPLRQVCCDPRLSEMTSGSRATQSVAADKPLAMGGGGRRDTSLSGWFSRREVGLQMKAEEALRSVAFESHALAAKKLISPILSPGEIAGAMGAGQLSRAEANLLPPSQIAAIQQAIDLYRSVLETARDCEPTGVRLDDFARVHATHNIGELSEQLARAMEAQSDAHSLVDEISQLRAIAAAKQQVVATMQQEDTAAVRFTVQKTFEDLRRKAETVADAFMPETALSLVSSADASGEKGAVAGGAAGSSSSSAASSAAGGGGGGGAARIVHAASTAVAADDTLKLQAIAGVATDSIVDAGAAAVPSLSALELWIDGFFMELQRRTVGAQSAMGSSAAGPGRAAVGLVASSIANNLVGEASDRALTDLLSVQSGRAAAVEHALFVQKGVVWPAVHSVHALHVEMKQTMQRLKQARSKSYQVLGDLLRPTQEMVLRTNNCSSCRADFGGTGPPCDYCSADAVLRGVGEILRPRVVERKLAEYQGEDKLKALQDRIKQAKKDGKLDEETGRGKRGRDTEATAVDADAQSSAKVVDSAFLRVLKEMVASQGVHFELPFRVRGAQPSMASQGKGGSSGSPDRPRRVQQAAAAPQVKELLAALQTEQQHILTVSSRQADLLATADYMVQAKQRVQLLPPGVPMPEGILANQYVQSKEVAARESVGHMAALASSRSDLSTALSKLKHTQLLLEQDKERQAQGASDINKQRCVICQDDIEHGQTLRVFGCCGMLLHVKCYQQARASGVGRVYGRADSVRCFLCKQVVLTEEIQQVVHSTTAQTTQASPPHQPGAAMVREASRARRAREDYDRAMLHKQLLGDSSQLMAHARSRGCFGQMFHSEIMERATIERLRMRMLGGARSGAAMQDDDEEEEEEDDKIGPGGEQEQNGKGSGSAAGGASSALSGSLAMVESGSAEGSVEVADDEIRVQPSMVVVRGHHSSKVQALVRCMRILQQQEPNAKSLLFSQWDSALKLCEVALNMNGIGCQRLDAKLHRNSPYSRGGPVMRFKQDPACQVLLMRLGPGHGAEGVTLQAASHVFFLEPSESASQEAQAVGRAYRMGQTKNVVVHHIAMLGTVEEAVLQMHASRRQPGEGIQATQRRDESMVDSDEEEEEDEQDGMEGSRRRRQRKGRAGASAGATSDKAVDSAGTKNSLRRSTVVALLRQARQFLARRAAILGQGKEVAPAAPAERGLGVAVSSSGAV